MDQNQANNPVVVRQLWGQLFLQANIRRPALQAYTHQAYDRAIEFRYQQILGCLQAGTLGKKARWYPILIFRLESRVSMPSPIMRQNVQDQCYFGSTIKQSI